nr:hypothetical protein [Tanacetum cinerariifolium]
MKAEMDKEERIAREKNKVNIAMIEEWDDVQATIDADRQLAEEIQAQEREQLSIKERYKHWLSSLNLEEKIMEESFKKNQAKVTKGSSKRAGEELEQESAKKQKLDEQVQAKVADDDTTELKRCLEIVPKDDDVAIEATPLSFKSPTINFNREDLEVLRSIIKKRFKKTKPVNDMDNLLFQTLKTMFEHHVEDIIWKYQQGAVKVHNWKLFDSCRVYCVTTKNMVYYLLVEKMYPFSNNILHQLWKDVRLQVDYEVEMAYYLLRLIRR